MSLKEIRKWLDIGCGRRRHGDWKDWTGIDITQIIDGEGKKMVDIVMDVCKEKLPFEDNTVEKIRCEDVLEHLDDLKFALNEMHRVLKEDGFIFGNVPICGTTAHWKDPTHKRCFIEETFSYFTGKAHWRKELPSHPRYADYGFMPWYMMNLKREGDILYFKMSPRKI